MPTSSTKESSTSPDRDDVKRNRNPIKHFFGISSLMGSFVVALGLGLLLHSLYRFFQQHHIPLHRKSTSPPPPNTTELAKDKWESVSYHGDISIQRYPMKNTQLYEYRYWLETNIPQENILKILSDPEKTHEWMPWLVEKEQRQEVLSSSPPLDESKDVKKVISKFRYIMPYPGMHMRQVVAYHSVHESVPDSSDKEETTRIQVQSLPEEDPNNKLFPLCNGCKRAYMDLEIHLISPISKSLQEEDEDVTTRIFLEQRMNPLVSKLPLFMVNAMNQKWGIAALHKLVRLSHRNLGWENLFKKYSWTDWKRSMNALFPVAG